MGTIARGDQARHRPDRRRGGAVSLDVQSAQGRRTCRSAATRWPKASRSRSRASSPRRCWPGCSTISCWSAKRSSKSAVALLLQIEKTVVEGAGAAGLAAVLGASRAVRGPQGRHRAVRRQYRHAPARQRAAARSRPLGPPGAAAADLAGPPRRAVQGDARIFDAHQINIIEIWHQRIFTHLPAKGLITDIECEARDRSSSKALVAALRAEGYAVSQVELN